MHTSFQKEKVLMKRKLGMANILVPYKQDEEKWRQHYLEQAMKQFKEKDMLKQHKDQDLHPQYVLPTSQLVAQAQSELKRENKELPVAFAPIKTTPEFENVCSPRNTK